MNEPINRSARAAEWKKGWSVAFSASLGMAVSVMHLYSLGVFIQPVEEELGWGRADISAGPAIVSVLFVVASPLVGILLDRVSARAIALPGLVIYCGAFTVLGAAGPSIWTWWGCWLLLAVGASLTSATVWTLGVARRFSHSRGLALAFTLAGTGLSSTLLPGVTDLLIGELGWRMAYVALGCIGALVALPTAVLFFKDGSGSSASTKSNNNKIAQQPGLGLRESLLSTRFWRLGIASLLVVIGVLAVVVHFIPILTERNLDRSSAVVIAGFVGLASIVGRIVAGFLLDRFHGAVVGAITFASPAVVCLLLLQLDGSTMLATIAAVGMGIALGAEIDVVAYLTTRYFGLKHYGVLFGIINVLLKIGSGMGPLIAGIVFDHSGSYSLLIVWLIVCFLISAVLMLSLGKYPVFATSVDNSREQGAPEASDNSQSSVATRA